MDLPSEGDLPALAGATEWLNSQPLLPTDLRGRVVLIDFWTYTCINWLRTLPYVRAWSQKYGARGLSVVGVHTPEFPFEQDAENVRRVLQERDIDYAVAIDNDYAVWRAFDNHYWPALYLADAEGKVRYHHFGEGRYEQSERAIQHLLTEAGVGSVDRRLVDVDARGDEAAADWDELNSPETYLGYERTERFASPGSAGLGRRREYALPPDLQLNHWALAGDWTVQRGAVDLNAAGGRIAFRFHARDLNLVMGPGARQSSVRFRVLLDGEPPGAAHGADVDEAGGGTVSQQRLYQLIRQPGRVADRTFEVSFRDPGVEAYVLTFG